MIVRVELVLQVGDQQPDPAGAAGRQRAAGIARDVAEQRRPPRGRRRLVSSETRGSSRSARETVGCDTPASARHVVAGDGHPLLAHAAQAAASLVGLLTCIVHTKA